MTDPSRFAPSSILVPLAEGFEETEAVAVVDVLRRAELPVTTAALGGSGPERPTPLVTGSHGIAVLADAFLADLDLAQVDALVLPGGMPGTLHLMQDATVVELARRLAAAARPVAAICAAPRVLAEAGLIDAVEVTSHPSVRGQLGSARVVDAPRVVGSVGAAGGRLVTSQGPGTALEFGIELVRAWLGDEPADALAEAMLVRV